MATRTTAATAPARPGITRSEGGTPSCSAARPQDGYRHEAFLWQGESEFLSGIVPFVLDGLVAGQPVMVAVIQERIDLLKTALGADAAAAVLFVDMAQIGRNPARIIPAWRSFLDEHGAGGRPVRGIGEPVWAGRRAAEVTECQIHEALLNLAVEPHVPLWLLCPYDVEALAPDVVTEAHRSHPALVDADSHHASRLYGGSDHAGTVFASDLPQPGSVTLRRELSVGDLLSVRQDVLDHAAAAGVPEGRTADLALAVHEVAANSLEHAGGAGLLRIWQDEESLVCEIRDVGRIQDPLVGRTLTAWDVEGGRGLWLANHLCDLVQVRSGRSGTTVRIVTWLQPVPGRARTAQPAPRTAAVRDRTARGKQDSVPIDRDHIVQVLRQRGDEDRAREAEQSLPAEVDPDEHADALERLGLNPQNLLDDDAAGLEDKLDPDDIEPYA